MAQIPAKNNVIKIISGSKGQYPIKLGIVPNQLAVTIYLHYTTIGGKSVPCWSYVSDGFLSLKQKEVVFTLKSREGEDTSKFPSQPLQLFLLLFKSAMQKKFDIGDIVTLGDKGLFGFSGLGFIYPLVQIPNAPFQRPTLTALLLSKPEFVTAQTFGLTRVISLLGFEHKRFPCIPFNDRERKSLSLKTVVQKTILKSRNRVALKRSSVSMVDGDHVVLNIPLPLRPLVITALKKHAGNAPLCLTLQLSPQHDGVLVWSPNQNSTEMHMKPGAMGEAIGGSFLCLEPGHPVDAANIVEDGFAMQFSPNSWQLFLNAIVNGQNLHLPGSEGGMDFSINWSDQLSIAQASANHELLDDDEAGGFFARLVSRIKRKS